MKAVISSVFGKLRSVLGKLGAVFGKLVSIIDQPIQRLRLLPPCKKIDAALQRSRMGSKPLQYHFLPYMTSVLRVLGWAVLVIGAIASVLFGLEVINDGLTIGETNIIGMGMGALVVVLGILASFLAWLFLLVGRELVCLFIHVKQNTENTAERVTREVY